MALALAACDASSSTVEPPTDLGSTATDASGVPTHCADQLLDGDETDTDCGGSCAPCPTAWTVPLQAVLVSDDDGGRPCPVDGNDVAAYVDEANRVWKSAGVQFLFDPDKDLSRLRRTLLNNIAGAEDPNWEEEIAAGDAVAAMYPGKALVLFRFGPGPSATGGAFSWTDYNFVAGAGRVSTVCGHWNLGLLAHELGHYLGLSHTFARVFGTREEAETYLAQHNGDPAVFDGDGLGDTAPDPFIAEPEYQCSEVKTATLGGQVLQLPRDNIMSYYEPRPALSSMQAARARWFVKTRLRHSMAMPDNHAARAPIEIDGLVASPEGGASVGPQPMRGFGRGWSKDQQLFCAFPPGGALSLAVPLAAAGRKRIALYATFAPDFGRFRILWDGAVVGVFDAFGPGVFPTGRIDLGVHDLTAATHTLRVELAGQNPASAGSALGLDCLDFEAAN